MRLEMTLRIIVVLWSMLILWTYRLRGTTYKKTVYIPVSKPVNISVCEIYVSHGRDISDEAAASATLDGCRSISTILYCITC